MVGSCLFTGPKPVPAFSPWAPDSSIPVFAEQGKARDRLGRRPLPLPLTLPLLSCCCDLLVGDGQVDWPASRAGHHLLQCSLAFSHEVQFLTPGPQIHFISLAFKRGTIRGGRLRDDVELGSPQPVVRFRIVPFLFASLVRFDRSLAEKKKGSQLGFLMSRHEPLLQTANTVNKSDSDGP